LLRLGDAPSPKARRALLAARKRLLKTLGGVNKKFAKGKLSQPCTANINVLFSSLSSTLSCRASG
jgi:hypothetical protein